MNSPEEESTAEKFSHFLDNLEVVLAQESAFVIMDNAPVHNGATFRTAINSKLGSFLPYSPSILNPIEEAFSAIQTAAKEMCRRDDPDIQRRILDPQGAARDQQTLLGCRLTILEEVAEEIVDTREVVNADKRAAFHRHMFTYLPRCMNMQNIEH